MKLLLDENLAARLAADLGDVFPGSDSVASLGLLGAADEVIWERARVGGYVLVTKDGDYHRLSMLHGSPPKVLWVRLGNCSTDDVARLLRFRAPELAEFEAGEAAFLDLG